MSEFRGEGGRAVVIGGGPAGLMAAEVLARGGAAVDVFDAMPSVGRKFLMAGKGGLNLTHAEPFDAFAARYGSRRDWVEPWLAEFGAEALREWARGLGVDTIVGSSGRVFPAEMKAAPLLRAWISRLRAAGVRFHMRHRWLGWDADRALRFATPAGEEKVGSGDTVVILALGGGSWARLGSDGAWVPWLIGKGVAVAPLRPANCGFDVAWSEFFRDKFAGQPVKPVVATFGERRQQGEFVITRQGVEGSLVYAFSAALRDAIEADGKAKGPPRSQDQLAAPHPQRGRAEPAALGRPGGVTLLLDLAPGKTLERLTAEIAHPRGSRSMASHLQSRAGVSGVKAGLLRECAAKETYADPARLAAAIKALPLRIKAPRPLDEAISSAGGVAREALDAHLMLRGLPGVFCAGEMLDWEAPTGGYLLTACFASGHAAGKGALAWLDVNSGNSALATRHP